MNHYTDKHSGIRYSEKEIKVMISKAKSQLLENQSDEYGFNYCVKCQEMAEQGIRIPNDMSHQRITCAHIKSVKECKEDSDIETLFSPDSMVVECLWHHQRRDKLHTQF